MLTALAFWALSEVAPPPAPAPRRVELRASARIITAVEVRDGQASGRHQRRAAMRDERPITLIEFE